MNIVIETIPSKFHRYPTCGDYWRDRNGEVQIRVSRMKNTDYEFLVMLHELIEFYLTEKRGIKEEDIKAFDEKFEAERTMLLHGPDDEPGDDKNAPYRKEHFFAEAVERIVANELGVDWTEYGKAVMAS